MAEEKHQRSKHISNKSLDTEKYVKSDADSGEMFNELMVPDRTEGLDEDLLSGAPLPEKAPVPSASAPSEDLKNSPAPQDMAEEDGDDQEDVDLQDFDDEFREVLQKEFSAAPGGSRVVKRVPVFAVLLLFLILIVLSAVLALLLAQMYNFPVPEFILNTLKQLI